MMMPIKLDRREFARRCITSIAAGFSFITNARASTVSNNAIDDILVRVFGSADAADDAGIEIIMPTEAESATFVPIEVTVKAAEKVAIIVHENHDPLALVATVYPGFGEVLRCTLIVEQDSLVSCYVFKEQQLYRAARPVRVSTSKDYFG